MHQRLDRRRRAAEEAVERVQPEEAVAGVES
jgi:hypothetical protein